MKINRLTLTNFKVFENKTFNFHPQFNLVIGINGSGKTSLLRAAAVALGGWAHAYIQDDKNRRPIDDSEIREVQKDARFDKTTPTLVSAEGDALIVDRNKQKKNSTIKWERKRSYPYTETQTSGQFAYHNPTGLSGYYPIKFEVLGADTLSYIEHRGDFELPLIAVYECDRLWIIDRVSEEESVTTQHSRFDAYKDCFHTSGDHKAIAKWLLKYQLAASQDQSNQGPLACMQAAACAAIEGCTSLRFDYAQSRVMLEFSDGKSTPFDHLSDGQRTMVGLFCDLARRASLLNPHLGKDACFKTAGVVLIDELDLHLHPSWQRRIVGALKTTFPLIQFICTTHSPQLVGQVQPDEIILLGAANSHPAQSIGMDSNWILEHVMDSTDRDPDIAKRIDILFQQIDNDDFETAKTSIKELRQVVGEHPDLVEANALITRYTRFADEKDSLQ
jgi:predicted ATP-binding protein involved in virulence